MKLTKEQIEDLMPDELEEKQWGEVMVPCDKLRALCDMALASLPDAGGPFVPVGECTCLGPDLCETCIANEEAYKEWLAERKAPTAEGVVVPKVVPDDVVAWMKACEDGEWTFQEAWDQLKICLSARAASKQDAAQTDAGEPVAWSYKPYDGGPEVLTHQPPDRVLMNDGQQVESLYQITPLYRAASGRDCVRDDVRLANHVIAYFDPGYENRHYYQNKEKLLQHAENIRSAPAAGMVPDGWQLVPVEPTDGMLSVQVNISIYVNGRPAGAVGLDAKGLNNAWKAMLAAAPSPGSGEKPERRGR